MKAGGSRFSAGTSGDLKRVLAQMKQQAIRRFVAHRAKIVIALTKRVLDRTPVWEGETIVNWQWTVTAPAYNHVSEINNGPPGHTNRGGSPEPPSNEPRRGPNEEVPMRSALAALALAQDSLADLYLSNNGSIAGLIEYGGAPTPELSRQPAGVLRIAIAEIMIGIYE